MRLLRKFFPPAAAALVLAACSQLPPEYDPVTQVGNAKRTVMGWFGDEEPPPPNVELPPAEGRPIPNLGTVPPPPFVTTGQRVQRQKELTALQADRAAAAKADATLRAQTGAQAPSPSGAPASPPAPPPLPPAPATGATPPAGTAPAPASTTASAAQPSPNSLPPALLNSTPEGAGPAPVIELPAPPGSRAAVAAGVLTTSERRGTVSFAPDTASIGAAGRNMLDAAAASALENDGRVRLVPAQTDAASSSPGLVDQRTKALREALAGAGLPADRVTIGEADVRRVDSYDVFVDY